LDSSLNLLLLSLCDITADGLRCALHRFGGDLQAGQDLHLLAAMIKGCLLADQGLHTAHGRRGLRIVNVQFDVGGKLARVTVGAQIIGTRYAHLTYGTENRLGSQFHVMRRMATTTRQAAPIL
jgi:hypothetical protein